MGRPRKVPSKDNLTEKQLAIYNYIKECVQIRNYPPSVRDICTEVGLKSTSSVFSYLNDLEQAGLIRKDPSHPRAIEILDKSHSGKASKSSKTKELSPVHSSPVEESMKEMVSVPVIGTVAAGTPIFAEENVSDHFPLPTEILPNQETFILKVKGDSMINVGIFDGDYLMVAVTVRLWWLWERIVLPLSASTKKKDISVYSRRMIPWKISLLMTVRF